MGVLMSRRQTVEQVQKHAVRDAAWARLRDGRGVEPEDLDRPGCFTPPALVRPVRPPRQEEEERLEISLEQREQVTNEEMCEVCEVWTADSLLPCRVCTKVYHDGCLLRMGLLSPAKPSEATEAAHSAVGWSCYHCDNLNSLLTEEEMNSLSNAFQQSNIAPESSLSLEDFLRYKGLGGQPSSQEEKERHALQFGALDPGQKGQVAWMDFLSHESLLLLQRTRTQEGLLHLLTGKERERAREAFLALNQHGDGLISQTRSVRTEEASWMRSEMFSNPTEIKTQESPALLGPPLTWRRIEALPETLTLVALCFAPSRTVTWPAFLRESTVYILAARPNSAAIHLKPLM
uniref:PHD finger protein 24 n=1 Tax=Naja naja TaxID=35670 RepID=A0A8C6YCB9_NAJNA